MNIRKILAGSLAAVMAGATIAMGGMATDLGSSDFNKQLPTANIVVGNDARTSDVVGAILAAEAFQKLGANLAGAGAPLVGTSTLTGGAKLDKSSQILALGDKINSAVSKLTDATPGLEDFLKTVSFVAADSNNDTTTINMETRIVLGSSALTFGQPYKESAAAASRSLADPEPRVNAGTSASSNPLYTLAFTFDRGLNPSDSDSIGVGIPIPPATPFEAAAANDFVEYRIDPSSTTSKLVLLGGGAETGSMREGDTVTVEIDGVNYDVTLVGVGSATSLTISIGKAEAASESPVQKTVTPGKTQTFTVDGKTIDVFVASADVSYLGKESQISSISNALIGGDKLTIENGAAVTKTSSGTTTTLQNTLATLTTSGSGITKVEIAVAAEDSTVADIVKGQPFKERIFGEWEFALNGLSPEIGSETDKYIKVFASGQRDVAVQIGGSSAAAYPEYTFTFVHNDATSLSDPATHQLADASNRPYHVVENEIVGLNEYVLLSGSDENTGGIFQVTSISRGSAGSYVALLNIATGKEYKILLEPSGYTQKTSFFIDGEEYHLITDSTTEVRFTWGEDSSPGNVGTATTIYPLVRSGSSPQMTLVKNVTITAAAAGNLYELPGSNSAASGTTQVNITNDTTTSIAGDIVWKTTTAADGGNQVIYGVEDQNNAGDQNFGYGILFLEPKTKTITNTDVRHAIVNLATTEGTTTITTIPSTTVFLSDVSDSGSVAWVSDANKASYLSRSGTLVTTDSNTNSNEFWFNDEQRKWQLAFGPNPQWAAAHTTVTSPPSALLDTEVTESTKTNKNLVLVGGPAINTLVAELADKSCVTSLEDWRSGGMKGKAEIALVNDAFAAGKWALVVAGHSAADTRAASTYLANNADSLAAGTYTQDGTSVTVAQC